MGRFAEYQRVSTSTHTGLSHLPKAAPQVQTGRRLGLPVFIIAFRIQSPSRGDDMRAKFSVALILVACVNGPAWSQNEAPDANHDNFYWLGQFNKASTVMVAEQGNVPRAHAAKIADAVARVSRSARNPAQSAPATTSSMNRSSLPTRVPMSRACIRGAVAGTYYLRRAV
jgi:hypothetical protein